MNNLAHRMTNKLELEARAFFRQLYNEQLAFIFKVPEELQQTPCDFFGFNRLGRAILIECKQVNRKKLPIGTSNGLQAHQWTALRQAHECGALSYLLWRRGEDTVCLPWSVCRTLSEGRRSIEWSPAWPPTISWQDFLRFQFGALPIRMSTAGESR